MREIFRGEGGYFSISRGQERACKNFQGVFDEKILPGGGYSKEKLIFQRVFSCSPHLLGGKYTFSLCFQGYFLNTKVSWGWVVKFHFPGEPSLIHGGVTNINWNSPMVHPCQHTDQDGDDIYLPVNKPYTSLASQPLA